MIGKAGSTGNSSGAHMHLEGDRPWHLALRIADTLAARGIPVATVTASIETPHVFLQLKDPTKYREAAEVYGLTVYTANTTGSRVSGLVDDVKVEIWGPFPLQVVQP